MTLDEIITKIESAGWIVTNCFQFQHDGRFIWRANLCTRDEEQFHEFGHGETMIEALTEALVQAEAMRGRGLPPLRFTNRAVATPKASAITLDDLGL